MIDYEAEANLFLEEYVQKTGRGIGPPVPIEQMIEVLSDFDILYDSKVMGEKESGRIDFGQKLITIRDAEILPRQRFSLAHEAGHLRMHSDAIDLLTRPMEGLLGDASPTHLSRRGSQDWHEVEANKFAAAVLMPLRLLRPAFEEARDRHLYLSSDPGKMQYAVRSYLASKFQVSRQAIEIRLKITGLEAELFTHRLF